MSSGGRDLQGASLRVASGECVPDAFRRFRRSGGFGVREVPYRRVLAGGREDRYGFPQGARGVDGDGGIPLEEAGDLRLVGRWYDDPREVLRHGRLYGLNGPRDVADRTVEPELAYDEPAVEVDERSLVLAARGDEREGDGEVVSASGLEEAGRGEVDDDFLARDTVSVGLEGGDGAEERFLHGCVREADQRDSNAFRDFGFDKDGRAVDAGEFHCVGCCYHVFTLLWFQYLTVRVSVTMRQAFLAFAM